MSDMNIYTFNLIYLRAGISIAKESYDTEHVCAGASQLVKPNEFRTEIFSLVLRLRSSLELSQRAYSLDWLMSGSSHRHRELNLFAFL